MRRLSQSERRATDAADLDAADEAAIEAAYNLGMAQGALDERARIVAMLRQEADAGPVGAGSACRYAADLIERDARS